MIAAVSRRSGFDYEADLLPIIKGKVPLPNFEEMPLEIGIAHIAAGGGLVTVDGVNNAKFAGSNSNWGHWARYWLKTTQGGALTGYAGGPARKARLLGLEGGLQGAAPWGLPTSAGC